MIIERRANKHIDPINFERPLSQAYWYGKIWKHELPDNIRLSLAGLRTINRALESKEIEQATQGVLGLCDLARGVIHISSPNVYSKHFEKVFYDNTWTLVKGIQLHRRHKAISLSRPEEITQRNVLASLRSFLDEEDEPDFLHRPTQYAYDRARQIIETAYRSNLEASPTPAIAPDGEGGLIFEWKSDAYVIRLIVAGREDGKSYIYRRGDNQSAIDHLASGSLLAQRLESTFAQ